jgi:hypothetical protein
VPDLLEQFYYTDPSALFAWETVAGFTGPLVDNTNGREIKSQSLVPDAEALCSSSMTVSNANNLVYGK